MSNSIDQRIVQMTFDNAQFEKGISSTLESLHNMEKTISDGSKGIDSLSEAFSKGGFSRFTSVIDDVSSRFSVMEMAAKTAVSNITTSVMDMGARMAKAVTIQPLMDGLDEYNLKLGSIQTIKTNTNAPVEKINESLAQLNTYADKTIYNFAEMTRNIGTFTAAGVGLEDSTTAIQGISNLAAASGSNAQQASVAMYQLSQALATGALKLQDWNSVVNAGMGGKLFQNALKTTAEVMGTDVDALIKKEGSFRESLKHGWITQDVLTQTLKNFTYATEEMTEAEKKQAVEDLKRVGYNEEQIKQIFKQAQAAEDAATKVKSFNQLIDTTKEALGSGWAVSWEYIIGDLTEATELFTGISKVLNGVIDGMSDARNKLLKGWHDNGGRDALVKSLTDVYKMIARLFKPIQKAFADVFKPLDGAKLAEGFKAVYDAIHTFKKTVFGSDGFKAISKLVRNTFTVIFGAINAVGTTIFTVLGTGIEIAYNAIKALGTILFPIVNFIVANVLTPVNNTMSDIFSKMGEAAGFLSEKLGGIKTSIFETVGKGFEQFAHTLNDVIEPKALELVGKLPEVLGNVASSFGDFVKTLFSGVELPDFLTNIIDTITGLYTSISEGASIPDALGPIADSLQGFGDSIAGDLVNNLTSFGASISDFISNLDINGIASWVGSFTKHLGDLIVFVASPVIKEAAHSIGELGKFFTGIFDTIGTRSGSFIDPIKDLGEHLQKMFDIASVPFSHGNLEDAFDVIKNLGSIDFDVFFTKEKSAVEGLFSEIGAYADDIDGPLSIVVDKIQEIHQLLAPVREVIGNIFNAIKDAVSSIQLPKIEDIMNAISLENLKNADFTSIEGVINFFKSIIDGIGSIVGGIFSILGKPVEALIGLFSSGANAIFTSITDFISNIDTARLQQLVGFLTSTAMNAGMIASFVVVMMTIKKIGDLAGSVGNALESIAGIGEALSKLGEDLGKAAKTMAKSELIKSLAISLGVLIAGVIILSLLDADKVWGAIGQIATLLLAIGAFIGVLGILQAKMDGFDLESISSIGLMLLEMAGAVAILAIVAHALGAMDPGDLAKGLLGIAAILGVVSFFSKKISEASSQSEESSHSLIDLAGALLIMYIAIRAFSGIPFGELVSGMMGIGAALVALYALSKIVEKMAKPMKKVGQGFKELGIGIAILAVAIAVISMMPVENLVQGFGIVIGVMILLAAYAFALKAAKLDMTLLSVSTSIIALAAAIAIIGASIALIGYLVPDTEKIKAAAIAMMGVVLAFTLMMVAINLLGGKSAAGAISLVGAAIGIGILVASLLLLSSVPFDQLVNGVIALASVMAILLIGMLAVGLITETFAVGFVVLAAVFLAVGVAALMIAGAFMIAAQAFNLIGTIAPIAMAGILQSIDMFVNYVNENRSKVSDAAANMIIGFAEGIYKAIPMVIVYVMMSIGAIAAGIVMGAPLIIAGFTEAMNQFIGFAGPTISNIGKAIMDGLGGILTGIADGIIGGITGLADQGKTAFDDFLYNVSGGAIGQKAEEASKEIAAKMQDGFGGSEGAKFGEPMVEGAKQSVEEVRAQGDEMAAAATEMMQKAQSVVDSKMAGAEGSEGGFDFVKAMGMDTESLGMDLSTITSNLDSAGFGTAITSHLSGMFTGGENGEGGFDLVKATGMDTESLGMDLSTITSNLDSAGFGTAITSHLSGMFTGGENGEGGFDVIKATGFDLENLTGQVGTMTGNIDASGMATAIPEHLTSSLGANFSNFKLGDIMQNSGSFDFSAILPNLETSGAQLPDAVASGAEAQAATIDYTDKLLPPDAIDEGTITSRASSVGEAGGRAFSTSFEQSVNVDGSGPIARAVASLNQPKRFSAAGTADGNAFTKAVPDAMSSLKKKVQSKMDDAVKGVSGYKDDMKKAGTAVGEDAAQGVANGLYNRAGSIYSAVHSIGRSMVAELRRSIKSKSPSKEFMWVGEDADRGLIVGLNNLKEDVTATTSGIGKEAVRAMSVQTAYMSELIDNIDDQPTIRPVLDLTDYEAGINQMNGLSTSAPFLSAGHILTARTMGSGMSTDDHSRNVTVSVNLNYDAGADANTMVFELAQALEAKLAMEGV